MTTNISPIAFEIAAKRLGADVTLVERAASSLIKGESLRDTAQVVEALQAAPLEPDYFQWLRHIFKIAEMRRDGEVFGLLARRFETTRSSFRNRSGGYYWGTPPAKKTIGPNAERAFSHETRYYFRRRVWRTSRPVRRVPGTRA